VELSRNFSFKKAVKVVVACFDGRRGRGESLEEKERRKKEGKLVPRKFPD
jgi:hypothetical protein